MDEPKERLADMQGTQETRHRDSFRVQAVIPENTKQDTSGTYQHIVLVSPPTSNPRVPLLLWKCGGRKHPRNKSQVVRRRWAHTRMSPLCSAGLRGDLPTARISSPTCACTSLSASEPARQCMIRYSSAVDRRNHDVFTALNSSHLQLVADLAVKTQYSGTEHAPCIKPARWLAWKRTHGCGVETRFWWFLHLIASFPSTCLRLDNPVFETAMSYFGNIKHLSSTNCHG
jgi:hypothetical protein